MVVNDISTSVQLSRLQIDSSNMKFLKIKKQGQQINPALEILWFTIELISKLSSQTQQPDQTATQQPHGSGDWNNMNIKSS